MSKRVFLGSALVIGVCALSAGVWFGFGLGAQAVRHDPHPLEWNGHMWTEFGPQEKRAFLGGFIAGAGASQVYPGPQDTVFDPDYMATELQRLRKEGELHFPFAPSLYNARIHDYLFYVDRRERPLYQAIAELNFRLQRDHH